ncbi:hypothetical protein K1719_034243 [Acacia pycnantha]|nr:hypothetical protein K1719_034243 [Acacia pycnantha]
MYLKKPLWSENFQEGKGESTESDGDTVASTAVGSWVRGLNSILKFLCNVAESDATIDLFNQTQSIPELHVVPVLFQHSLKEAGDDYNDDRVANLNHIFGVDPMKITSPSTDVEVALALRVLEGCCLLHPRVPLLPINIRQFRSC